MPFAHDLMQHGAELTRSGISASAPAGVRFVYLNVVIVYFIHAPVAARRNCATLVPRCIKSLESILLPQKLPQNFPRAFLKVS